MTAPVADEAKRRGRPRPDDTIQRDQLVLTRMREAAKPLTREEVAAAAELTKNLAYLSLWRLRKDGRVARSHEGGKHVWTVTEPAPDAA